MASRRVETDRRWPRRTAPHPRDRYRAGREVLPAREMSFKAGWSRKVEKSKNRNKNLCGLGSFRLFDFVIFRLFLHAHFRTRSRADGGPADDQVARAVEVVVDLDDVTAEELHALIKGENVRTGKCAVWGEQVAFDIECGARAA